MEITQENVIKVLKKVKNIEVFDFSYDINLSDDLGLDSLDYITAVFELEKAFKVDIPYTLAPAKTLTELVEQLKTCKPI
jgi:acyl carrier protein